MLNIQPLNGHVVLIPCEPEDKSQGGIYLPQSVDRKSSEGIVEALSLGYSSKVALGDRVLYKRGSGQYVEVEGKPRILVVEEDLVAKLFEFTQPDVAPAATSTATDSP